MSAASSAKAKTNCDAVNSGPFIINQAISSNSLSANSKAIKHHGAKLSQKAVSADSKPQALNIKQEKSIEIKQEPSTIVKDFHIDSQNLSDVQKVLKQEQELQKQLYSGANVASGWLRVNHNNKVIYIR